MTTSWFTRPRLPARPALGAAVLVAIIVLLCPGRAQAHAHLVQADPAAGAVLAVSPPAGRFSFDENLNAALSSITIRDAAGRRVTTDTGRLAPGTTRELVVALPRLAPGLYTVQWTSDSADDGHILHGFYTFVVGTAGPTAGVASPSAGMSEPPLDGQALAQIAARWLLLLLLSLWSGLVLMTLIVLRPGARLPASCPAGQLAAAAAPRALLLAQGALLGLLAATWLELVVQGVGAVGGSLQALSPSLLHALLVGTRYGTLWLVRLALILVALVIALPRASGAAAPATRLRPIGEAVLAGAVLLALAFSGHAATVPTDVPLSIAIDGAHLLAMAGWLGGIVALVVLVIPALSVLKPHAREEALLYAVDRFSPVAAVCVAVLALSGIYNALQRIVAPDELLTTSYGRALLVKLFLVALMVLVSASHVFGVRRRLRRSRSPVMGGAQDGQRELSSDREAEAHQLVGLLIGRLQIEPVLGAGVLLCVAVMAATLPARQGNLPRRVDGTNRAVVRADAAVRGSRLRVRLMVSPGALGRNEATVTLFHPAPRGGWLPEDDGQVRLKLVMPAMAAMGTAFVDTTMVGGGRYRGVLDIAMGGDWRVDVLVRTPADPLTYRDAPFRLTAGLYGQPPLLRP